MLNDTTMTKLEALLGIEGGALKEAMESDDSKEIKIPEGQFVNKETHQVFSNEELTTREDSLKKTHEKAGAEMLVKEYKRANDLNFEGKGLDKLLEVSNAAALKEAGKEPSEKITELEAKNLKLVGLNEEWESKHDTLLSSNNLAEGKRKTDANILSHMKGEYNISNERMLTMFNSEHDVVTADGVQTISKGGVKLEHEKTFAPLSMDTVVTEWAKDFSKTPEGGNGGGDNGGGSAGGSMDEFNARQKTKGNNVGSEAYMQDQAAEIKAGTLVTV